MSDLNLRELTDREQQTLLVLAPLMCGYRKSGVTENNMKTYAIALSDIDLNALSVAVIKCLQTKTFFPAIAEIREAADNMVEYVTGSGIKSPDQAWKELCRVRQDYWPYKEPLFSTPEIEEAVRAMGWTDLCTAEAKDIGTTRAQFLKMYESVCRRKKETRINAKVLQSMETSVSGIIDETIKRIGQGKEVI